MKQMAVIVTMCSVLWSCSVFDRADTKKSSPLDLIHDALPVPSIDEFSHHTSSIQKSFSIPARTLREPIHRSRSFPELSDIKSPMSRVALRFKQVPAPVFANALSRLGKQNIVVKKNAQTQLITIYLDEMPWHEALRAITDTHQLGIDIRYGVIFLNNQSNNDTKDGNNYSWRFEHTELFQLVHTEPEEIKKIIEPLFEDKERPKFSTDAQTRTLIVQGSKEHFELIHTLIKRLDRPVQQVLIEAFVVEANEDFERSFGTRFRLNSQDSNGLRVAGVIGAGETASQNGESASNGPNLAVNLPIANPTAGIGLLLDSNRLRLELTALEAEGKSRIVSNPRIFTLDKQEAVIFQGDEVPYLTTSDNGTQTEFKQAGLRLAVTPFIISDNQLQLNIVVNKDTVDTRTRNPPITRREVSTRLKVADKAVIVIGGIYFNTQVDTLRQVPVLGKLPVLGRLFRQTIKSQDTKRLLVFISPKISG